MTPGVLPVTVFGPVKKFKPVICRSVEKETSLHSSLMEAIQSGSGKDRLKKVQLDGWMDHYIFNYSVSQVFMMVLAENQETEVSLLFLFLYRLTVFMLLTAGRKHPMSKRRMRDLLYWQPLELRVTREG